MKVPLPSILARKISNDAVKFARIHIKNYGWSDKALQALQPMAENGLVGIRTTQKYLMYQERGTKPFLMNWVQGRTIPMGGTPPTFRRGSHVGEPGWVSIPGRGKVWRQQRWRHPGVQGRSFMRNGLNQAIDANQPLVQQYVRGLLR